MALAGVRGPSLVRSWVTAAAALLRRRRKAGYSGAASPLLVLARWASRCLEASRVASERALGSCDETPARTGCQLSRTGQINSISKYGEGLIDTLALIFSQPSAPRGSTSNPQKRREDG